MVCQAQCHSRYVLLVHPRTVVGYPFCIYHVSLSIVPAVEKLIVQHALFVDLISPRLQPVEHDLSRVNIFWKFWVVV